MSHSSPHFSERHGLVQKRARRGSTALFLLAIGGLVTAAGVWGLKYRDQLWDDPAQRDHVAAPPDSNTPELTMAHFTVSDDIPHTSTVVTTEDSVDGGKDETKAADLPEAKTPTKAEAPKPRTQHHSRVKPKTETDTAPTGDMFNKPD